MSVEHLTVASVASILPPTVVTNEEVATRAPSPQAVATDLLIATETRTRAQQIERKTGLRTRRYFHPTESPVEVGTELLQRLMTPAGDWGSLDAVLVSSASITGFPGVAQQIVALARTTAPELGHPFALDINSAACGGFVYALTIADALMKAAGYRRIAILALEFASRCIGASAPGTAALFGDAAAGLLLSTANGGLATLVSASARSLCTTETIGLLHGSGFRASNSAIPLPTTEHWFVAGPPVAIGATQLLVSEIKRHQEAGTRIDWLIPHGANLTRILLPACKRAGIATDRLCTTFAETGNTSSASIPLALDHLLRSGCAHPGDTALLIGFGASYAYGSAVLEFA